MKEIIFVLCCFWWSHIGYGQSLISFVGGEIEGSECKISWSMGEPITVTLEGEFIATQGFQQPDKRRIEQPSTGQCFLKTEIQIINDGITTNNPFLKFGGGEDFTLNSLIIVNRWGELIKEYSESEGYNNTWDGTDNSNNTLPHGTYYYILNYSTDEGECTRKGPVYILK